jgi:hypothetical protein
MENVSIASDDDVFQPFSGYASPSNRSLSSIASQAVSDNGLRESVHQGVPQIFASNLFRQQTAATSGIIALRIF